jgi:hypothetical protein
MAANNSTATVALNQNQEAAFGVVLNTDGSIQVLTAGEFDAGYANEIACQLILLASGIRNAARAALRTA